MIDESFLEKLLKKNPYSLNKKSKRFLFLKELKILNKHNYKN